MKNGHMMEALRGTHSMRSGDMVPEQSTVLTKDRNCDGCIYYKGAANYYTCEYLTITGHMRGCKPGKDCNKKETKE